MQISFKFRTALTDHVHTYNTAWEGATCLSRRGLTYLNLQFLSVIHCVNITMNTEVTKLHKNKCFKIIKVFLQRTSNTKSVILFSAINLRDQRKNFQLFSLLTRRVYFRVSSKNSILQDCQHSDSVLILLRENQILTMFFSEKHIPLGIIERGNMPQIKSCETDSFFSSQQAETNK